MAEAERQPSYTVKVLQAHAFRVVAGANHGDPMTEADTLCAGDVYRLVGEAAPLSLAVADAGLSAQRESVAPVLRADGGVHRVAEGSEAGLTGAPLQMTARATVLAPDGHSVDLMLLETFGEMPEVFVFPLGPLEPGLDYTLAGVAEPGEICLSDVVPFAFVAGTRITMADGTQRSVDTLNPGDVVLTRDAGPQPLRAVLAKTERALGPHAPVVIAAETIGNPGDLILSQHQRLLVYQRGGERLTATAEMLVRAGDLVDGERVYLRRGGFADYVTLVLDTHEMLFAECVAVESLEVSPATRHRLAEDQARAVESLSHTPHYGSEIGRDVAAAARARLLAAGKNRTG
ncbi:MAG: Hint domain-containing protein [Pseudomonadota bacterium]